MADKQDQEEFWRELEEEVGGTIEWASLGENLLTCGDVEKNRVGIFFMTKSHFYFQTYPQKNFVESLVVSVRKKKKEEKKKKEIIIPREDILEVSGGKTKGLSRFFMGSSLPHISIQFRAAEGDDNQLRFSLISKEKARELFSIMDMEQR